MRQGSASPASNGGKGPRFFNGAASNSQQAMQGCKRSSWAEEDTFQPSDSASHKMSRLEGDDAISETEDMTLRGSEFSSVCEECNARVNIFDAVEHADWHMAMRLQQEDERVSLGSRQYGDREQAATAGGNGAKKPGKTVVSKNEVRLANTRRLEDYWGKK